MRCSSIQSFAQVVLFLIFLGVLSGCDYFGNKNKKKPIARIFDNYLYEDDLFDLIPPGTSKEDSVYKAKVFIDNWLRNQLELKQAIYNLSKESIEDIDKKVDNYRKSLTIFEYERELIIQKMDTIVSDWEIATHYETNRKNFELKDYILKVVYIRVVKDAPKVDKLIDWLESGKPEDFHKIEDYCHRFAEKFIVNDASWIYLDQFQKEVNIKIDDELAFLSNKKAFKMIEDDVISIVKILDYQLKDELSPMELEKGKIKKIILNNRKRDFLKNMKNEIYNKELANGNVEVYN